MIILIQSRLSSSRLPAKALLPIRGLPSIVLAARRAGNHGATVRVITSTDASDDVLTSICCENRLDVYRGELDNVLARTVGAVAALPDDAVAVRLTGDNLLPDQNLIEGVVSRLQQQDADYAGIIWPVDGLPYGLSVEAFRVGVLRKANAETDSTFDREHTTPWIRRNCRAVTWPGLATMDIARLRCTIDTFDDYLRMQRIFAEVADPVQAPWKDLVRQLQAMPDAPAGLLSRMAYYGSPGNDASGVWISKTVVDASSTARINGLRTISLLREAIACGVTHFLVDTGDSESVKLVGQALARGWSGRVGIVGKLSSVAKDCGEIAIERDMLRLSCNLGVPALEALLLPSDQAGDAWAAAKAAKELGLCRFVGLWGSVPNVAQHWAEIVLDRIPPAETVPALGTMGVHRVVTLSGASVWTELA